MEDTVKYKIEGKGKTLKEVLSQKYVIDYFQREYKWERKHIEQLLYDLDFAFFESYKEGDVVEDVVNYKPYFLGPFIVCQNKNTFSLIDGQQRLTSMTLLLIYLMKHFEETKEDLKDLVFMKRYGKASYNLQMEDRKNVMDHLYLDMPLIDDANLSVSELNLLERYADIEELFPERLKSAEIINLFDCWLQEKIIFVEILSYSDENAYTIFETMNDRGCNLTSAEMMKSFLLSKISDEQCRRECNEVWKGNILRLIEQDRDGEAEFFRAWIRGKYLSNMKDSSEFEAIGTGFHRWIKTNYKLLRLKTDTDIEAFIKYDMSFFVNIFLTVRKAEQTMTKGLEIINAQMPYSFASSLIYPLYLSAINQSDTSDIIHNKIKTIAKALDSFVIRRILNGQTIAQSSIRSFMYNLIEDVRGKELELLHDIFHDFLEKYCPMSSDSLFIDRFPYKFLRYFHYRVNMFLCQFSMSDFAVPYKSCRSFKLIYMSVEVEITPNDYKDVSVTLGHICLFNRQEDTVFPNIYHDIIKNGVKAEWKLPEELMEQLTKANSICYENILFNYVLSALWGKGFWKPGETFI